MPEFNLSGLDLGLAAIYIAAIISVGVWVGRKKDNAEGFLLAERGGRWPIVGFALIAANFSGTHYVGLAGAGYEDGVAVWNYEWMATIILVFFTLFIMPFYLRSKVSTMPQFLEERYDRRSRYVFSGFTIVTAMVIDAAGALYAGAITLGLLFPQLELWMLVWILALFAGIYVVVGGLEAVMITDTIDGVLLLIAGSVIFTLGFMELGSWDAIVQAAPENGMNIINPVDDEFLPWPGIFTGVLWLGFYYWTTNHVVVQKVLSAKNIDHGRLGALFAGFMQLPFLVILILPGIMARAIYPDLENVDQAWPAMAFDLLPHGIRGIVLAALVVALMSTLDSVLNGAAGLLVNDFIKTRKKEFSDKKLLIIARSAVAGFMVIAALWAPLIANFPTIVEYFQSFLGHVTMPVVVVFLMGLFWKRGTKQAAFYTLSAGIPLGFAAFFAGEVMEVFDIQFLYSTGIMLVISAGIYLAVTAMTEMHDEKAVKELVWTPDYWREETKELADKPWYFNYRVISLVIIIITILAVLPFTGFIGE
jgi:solute:Na+ symporter, SSS family